MRYECDECLVKFSRYADYADDHTRHYHSLKKKIVGLYKTYLENQIKWRIDPSLRDRMNEWKAKLIKLSSEEDIRLDFDVFVNVLFEPCTYFENANRDDEFVSSYFVS